MPEPMQRKSVGIVGQTVILFKKNFLSKIRQEPKKLAGEILIPVIYLGILCYLITVPDIKTYEAVTEPERSKNVLESLPEFGESIVHIVPDSVDTQSFAATMASILKQSGQGANKDLEFVFLANESALVDEYNNGTVQMAIVFAGAEIGSDYTIRIRPDGLEHVLPAIGTRKLGLDTCRSSESRESLESPVTCPVNGYYYTNFLALQNLVDQAFLMLKYDNGTRNNSGLTLQIQNYPKAEYNAGLPIFLRVLIPLYSVIPMAQFINNLLVLIVTEKENKIKDGLRIIGVSDVAYWTSWFGVYSLLILFFSLIFTLVMHFMVLTNFDPLILFLLFALFGFSVITLAFALTPFFHKPKTAGIVGTLVLQFTSLLFMLQTFVGESSEGALIPLRIISSLAFTTALDAACAYEYVGGIGWSDLTFGGRGEGILYSFIFLIFDILFYAALATYLDNIIPNMFGVRRHPLYCFKLSYWVGRKDNTWEADDTWKEEGDDAEKISPDMVGKEAVRIRHIEKTYYPSWTERKGKPVHAVKGVSLNIYEGQITAILGRNGAGKSTLFNILIGLVSPTKGGATIFGNDIRDPYDLAKLRKSTGVCLQYDLHFSALTVEEHLEFYGKLRGLNKVELKTEINTILADLRLKDKRNTHAAKLSGGQKRKLSIGIALIGDPKIILLDEPTAGVDPVSRRHLWDLLSRNKNGKVILLVTHFLDEADILADRKVIIHDGELKCVGSSLFLKNRFGVGYYLMVELNDRNTSSADSDSIISKWIPSALDTKKTIGSEIKYSLPHSEVSKFSSLFADLEEAQEVGKAGIKSFGVSMTTLEEVFLKISTSVEPVEGDSTSTEQEVHGDSDEQNLIDDVGEIKINPMSIFWTMCKLRILRLIRSPQAIFFMLFMPVLLAGGGLYLVKISNPKSDESLRLSDPKGVYSTSELHIAVNNNSAGAEFGEYLETLGFTVHGFDGEFASLLNVNQLAGTMAAVSMQETAGSFVALVNINGTFVHSIPIVAAAIRQYIESNFSEESNLVFTSKPFVERNAALFDVTSFYVIFLLGPAFIFTAVGMVIEVVYDREIRARNHLRVNGLTFKMYFSSIFAVFGTMAVITTILQLSLIAIFGVKAFMNPYAFIVTAGLLFLYIPPSMLFAASFSYLFERMETAQSLFSQLASWSGTIAGLVIVILDASGVKESITILIHTIFCIVDVFYVPFGVFYFVNKQYFRCSILGTCDDLNFSNYTGPEFSVMLFALLGQIPVFLLLLVVADVLKDGGSVQNTLRDIFKLSPRVSGALSNSDANSAKLLNPWISARQEDPDVVLETERVNTYFNQDLNARCVVAVQDIVKHYPAKIGQGKEKKKIIKNVVNKLNLMVEEGEVFGLLGHNGAGKTTALRIITAEESPNEGRVKLCGMDVKSNMSEAFLRLGYCPQHDALWENLHLSEHLQMYSAIRGVQPENRNRVVDHFLFGLKIKEHADKRASDLSGGTKRKLSYALSMLGAPKVVLLDEPSTGMDPQSKRFLWNTVLGTFRESRGAILTTHSMEEADALCTRIAIMVKGTLLCIGTPQHLKTKYGDGYTLEIKIKNLPTVLSTDPAGRSRSKSEAEVVFDFVKQNFPGCQLNECFGNRAIFSVPTSSVRSISNAFRILEELKQKDEVEEYSFSQTTLEQVFLGFAKENEENEEE